MFINKQIKTSPQCSKIFKTTDGVDGQNYLLNLFQTDRSGRGFTGMACKIVDRNKLVPCKNSLRESVKIC